MPAVVQYRFPEFLKKQHSEHNAECVADNDGRNDKGKMEQLTVKFSVHDPHSDVGDEDESIQLIDPAAGIGYGDIQIYQMQGTPGADDIKPAPFEHKSTEHGCAQTQGITCHKHKFFVVRYEYTAPESGEQAG